MQMQCVYCEVGTENMQ